MTGHDIVTAARTFIGVRYRHQGRTREGLDCIGLPVAVRAVLGLATMDASAYGRVDSGSAMLDYCKAHMIPIAREDLQPGDVLVQMDGVVRHMAIVSDYPGSLGIIHAWLPNKRVTECRLDDHFMKTVRGCFRFPELAEVQA